MFFLRRREEFSILRNTKPQTGERRNATSIPDPVPVQGTPPEPTRTEPMGLALSSSDDEGDATSPSTSQEDDKPSEEAADSASKDTSDTPQETTEEAREMAEEESADDDSVEAVGKEEAAEQDRDMMDDKDGPGATKQDDETTLEVDTTQATKVATMFRKILSLGSQGGQVILNVGAGDDSETKEAPLNPGTSSIIPAAGPSPSQPTIMHNGRMVRLMRFGWFIVYILTFALRRYVIYQTMRFMLEQQRS